MAHVWATYEIYILQILSNVLAAVKYIAKITKQFVGTPARLGTILIL